jgi:hypothetical protein
MKTILNALLVASLLVFAGAASAADPVIGTWTLNLAKSKFKPGPAPKSDTRTYAETADGIAWTWKSVAADGKETTVSAVLRKDGKDAKVTGSDMFDTIVVKKVDGNTVHSVLKREGLVVGEAERTISKDGKELKIKAKGAGPDAVSYENEMVYDKQ